MVSWHVMSHSEDMFQMHIPENNNLGIHCWRPAYLTCFIWF